MKKLCIFLSKESKKKITNWDKVCNLKTDVEQVSLIYRIPYMFIIKMIHFTNVHINSS